MIRCLLIACAVVVKCIYASYDGESFDGDLEYDVMNSPCVRLFSNKGDMGCRTTSSSVIGALYEIMDSSDITELSGIDVDFAVLAPSQAFTSNLLSTLASLPKAKGLIVYWTDGWIPTESSGLYSPDVQSPQGEGTYQADYTIGNTYKWNPYGNGEMYSSFQFPVVQVSSIEDVGKLKAMSAENRKYGLKANRVNVAEFQYYMGPDAMTSQQCLHWTNIYGNKSPQCLPVGGSSIWATAGVLDNRMKIVVTTGIDSTSFFHDLARGANDAAASIAAVLSAAEAISRSQPSSFSLQPLFFLSNAEEWGYAGSRRFVRDITSGISCTSNVNANSTNTGLPLCTDPIYPSTLFESLTADSISDIIAIDQVGRISNGNLYVHALQEDSPTVDTVTAINYGIDGYKISASSANGNIPPTPLSSFLTEISALEDKGIVVSGYDADFNDPKYHSMFDSSNSTVSIDDVIATATALSKMISTLCGGDAANVAPVNSSWTTSLLDCLLSDWTCPFMEDYVNAEISNIEFALHGDISIDKGTTPPTYYVGTLNAANGGLPVVQHEQYLYGKYDGQWNDRDRAFTIPNYLEAFIRSALSYHLAAESIEKVNEEEVGCTTATDCGNCTILEYRAVRKECLLGVCVCPSATYHLAVDPGVESDVYPNQFVIVDEDMPCYTEPYWRNIGLRVYPQANENVLIITLTVGLCVAIISSVGMYMLGGHLRKIKVL